MTRKLSGIISIVCSLILFVFFLRRCWEGLWFLSFGDEAEHLLGARILGAGGRLYVSYIDTHGPVIFMLSQIYGAVMGWHFPQGARVWMPVLAVLAAFGVFRTPAVRSAEIRLVGAGLFLGGIASWWLVTGFYLVSFYPVGGFLCSALLALIAAPAWRGGVAPLWAFALAGSILTLTCFTAYAYGPGIVLMAMAGLWPVFVSRAYRPALAFVAGCAVAFGIVFVWLEIYGSVSGFIAYHILFNQRAYAPFIAFSPTHLLTTLLPSTEPGLLSVTVAHVLVFIAWLLALWAGGRRGFVPVCLTFVGILLLNARAAIEFKDGQSLIVGVAAFVMAMMMVIENRLSFIERRKWVFGGVALAGLVMMELVARQAPTSPFGWSRAEVVRQPHYVIYRSSDDQMSRTVRALTTSRDAVLAIPYFPEFYWMTERMPPARFYEYLPWDSVWAQRPVRGFERNLCTELDSRRPKLIYYRKDSELLFDKSGYYDCIRARIAQYYDPVPGVEALFVLKQGDRSGVLAVTAKAE